MLPSLIFITFIYITLILSPTATAMNLTNKNVIQKLVVDEANRQGLDPTLALAIAKVESNFDPYALSNAGAMGVMQIMPATAKSVFGIDKEKLYDANINISLGITFIKQLLTRYDQRLDIALSHYNGGSAVQDELGRLTVIPATKKYVNKVLSAQDKFKYKAYQLSSISSDKLSRNKPTQYHTSLPLVKEVIKPDKLYSATTFDQSLYKKIEQLRTLRLHNIMRNTQNKSVNTSQLNNRLLRKKSFKKINYRGLSITNKKQWLAEDKTLSAKRKKVLHWEAMFN